MLRLQTALPDAYTSAGPDELAGRIRAAHLFAICSLEKQRFPYHHMNLHTHLETIYLLNLTIFSVTVISGKSYRK